MVSQARVDQCQSGLPGLWAAEHDPQGGPTWSDATLMGPLIAAVSAKLLIFLLSVPGREFLEQRRWTDIPIESFLRLALLLLLSALMSLDDCNA